MQIAVIDCIHEPRSTPTRVIRGNARAYWGARYNRRGVRLFTTNRDARNYFDRAKPSVAHKGAHPIMQNRRVPFDRWQIATNEYCFPLPFRVTRHAVDAFWHACVIHQS